MATGYRHRHDLHPLADPIRHLLHELAGTTGAPTDNLRRLSMRRTSREQVLSTFTLDRVDVLGWAQSLLSGSTQVGRGLGPRPYRLWFQLT